MGHNCRRIESIHNEQGDIGEISEVETGREDSEVEEEDGGFVEGEGENVEGREEDYPLGEEGEVKLESL